MQTVSCPSCGAQVQFRSHAAVMAVCEFCQTTVLKDGDAVKDLGKMSSVLEDFSPLQIGSAGSYGDRAFTVVGRIQLRYQAGIWNEWYVLYDDASTAWLGDSSGLFTMTAERQLDEPLPAFGDLAPTRIYRLAGASYTAAEIREADCIGGQGELPFRVGAGYKARVADFRSGASFLTLDYSDGERPVAYTGLAVTLESLKCQLLRDDEQIKASAGKYRGKVDALDCPSCGASIGYVPGKTAHLVCPSCQAQVGATGPKALVLEAGERIAQVKTTLELGAQAKLNGVPHQLIGLMRRVDDEGNGWTEYLLYNTRSAFTWLVETDDGWYRANVTAEWPAWDGGPVVMANQMKFRKLYDYDASVTFAAGAFNWQVKAGDRVRVSEFESGTVRLAAEVSEHEMTWSRSTPVARDQLRAWFGKAIADDALPPPRAKLADDTLSTSKYLWWIVGLNAIPLLFEFSHTWIYTVLAMLAIYLPAKFLSAGGWGKK